MLEPLVDITDDIARTMRTDSSVAWKLLHAVVFGKLEADVSALMCGKLSHSRWLTAGMRCLILYMGKYKLTGQDEEALKMLAIWATQVYLPLFS